MFPLVERNLHEGLPLVESGDQSLPLVKSGDYGPMDPSEHVCIPLVERDGWKISCLLLDDLLTLFWEFAISWASCSRSGQCVECGYQVGSGCVGRGYPVGGGGSWLLSVS